MLERIEGRALSALSLILLLYSCAPDPSHTLSWDANRESDMKEYRVYSCSTEDCTDPHLLTVVHHEKDIPRFETGIPNGDSFYFVVALNVVEESSLRSEIVHCEC